MAEGARSSWGRRLSLAAFLLGVGAPLAALIAAAGAGQDWWDKLGGLAVLRYAFFVAIAAVVLGIAALVVHLRKRSGRPLLIALGLAAALAYLGYIGAQIRLAQSVPFIHDATTDLADPPAFRTLKLREDNLAVVPDGGDPTLERLSPLDRWKQLHGDGYPDLKPLLSPLRAPAATRATADLARARGWQVVTVDEAGGLVEATDSVSLFAFKDDVVIRVRPAPGGSRIDMRSVSRIGVSDLGVNARRVREFMRDLREASPPPAR